MPTDLKIVTEKIHLLRGTPRSDSAVESVEAALYSKWEGIQSAAVQVLGSWGDPISIARLRDFLAECQKRESGWSIHGVIIKELARCVDHSDSEWVLDHYFSVPGVLAKHVFLPVVLSLPPHTARERLIREGKSTCRNNRQAAMKALGNMEFPDMVLLLKPFLTDDDPEIRRGAVYLSGT